MFHSLAGAWLACLALLTAFGVSAQTPPARPKPQDDGSAFETYQHFTEEKLRPWKDANDTVGRVGGWKAYAREAQGESAATSATQAMPATPATADPHAGHGEKSK